MRFCQRTNAIIFAAMILSLASLCLTLSSLSVHARQSPQTPAASPVPQATPQATPPPPTANADTPDDEVETVETNLVNVLFNAVDKNRRFVTTLRPEDVQLFENDQPQVIATFERETALPLSLAILVDVSGSQERTLPDEQAAAHIFINSVLRPDRDRAAILSFSGDATVEQDLTGNLVRLNRAIDRVEIAQRATPDEIFIYEQEETEAARTGGDQTTPGLQGWTAIWDSIWATATDLLSQTPTQTRRAIILLSDGVDSTSRLKKEQAIEAVVAANAVVYSIGIGSEEFDEGALKKISERTGGRAFFPETDAELNAAFAQIQAELRSQYLVSYSPTNRARDGSFRQLKIEVVNRELRKEKLKLTYRNGYFARAPAAVAPVKTERPSKSRLARPKRPLKKKK